MSNRKQRTEANLQHQLYELEVLQMPELAVPKEVLRLLQTEFKLHSALQVRGLPEREVRVVVGAERESGGSGG